MADLLVVVGLLFAFKFEFGFVGWLVFVLGDAFGLVGFMMLRHGFVAW